MSHVIQKRKLCDFPQRASSAVGDAKETKLVQG